MRDEMKCLHAGYTPKNAEPRVMPIVQSITYVYDSMEEMAEVFDDPMKSLIYSRFGNPTVMAVEDKLAQLEGGMVRLSVGLEHIEDIIADLENAFASIEG